MVNTKDRETIGIETAGDSVDIRPYGRDMVEIAIRGDGAADYRVDAREDSENGWVNGIMGNPEYTGQSDYDDTLFTGWHEIRVYCTNGTGGSGDEAEIILCAGGK